eukprot:jgi/Chlat1/3790/Chrsp259S03922
MAAALVASAVWSAASPLRLSSSSQRACGGLALGPRRSLPRSAARGFAAARLPPAVIRAGQQQVVLASSASDMDTAIADWPKQDTRRFLHVVYRVGDLEKTGKFYEALGMKQTRYRDIADEKYINAFYAYGDERENFAVELTKNYDVDSYDIGTGFGHFGIATPDVRPLLAFRLVAALVEKVRATGIGKVKREPGPVKGGQTVIAFVEDPTGYQFELLQRPSTPEPLCQVMLRVGDLERSIDFYTKVFGMQLLRTRDVPEYKYTIAMLGYGPEKENTVLELTYNYGVTEYTKGTAYAQIALSTQDVYKTAEAVKASGMGKVIREAGPLPGLGTKITAVVDPDGWKTVFVDNEDFLKELS